MADFTIRQGDTLPLLTATVLAPSGAAANIQGGSTARLRMRKQSGGAWTVDGTATIVDAPTGKLSYAWQAADTATPGTYEAVFVLTTPAGQLTVPNLGFFTVLVTAAL